MGGANWQGAKPINYLIIIGSGISICYSIVTCKVFYESTSMLLDRPCILKQFLNKVFLTFHLKWNFPLPFLSQKLSRGRCLLQSLRSIALKVKLHDKIIFFLKKIRLTFFSKLTTVGGGGGCMFRLVFWYVSY